MISIHEIKEGRESAFAEVFDQFHAKLYYYFYNKTRSEDMSKELVQLTFIKLWQFRHTLSAEIVFDAQLFRMATSSLIDYLRSLNALKKRIVPMPENTFELPDLSTAEAERNFEHIDELHALTNSLSPVRKKVFILSRLHGRSYKEIASELSISVSTVEDHMVKALKHIRSAILQLLLL